MLDIIVISYQNLSLLQNCINSIASNTTYPYRLIIVDNNSRKEVQDYIKSLVSDPILNDKNIGFTKAVNQGIKVASRPYFAVVCNDTEVSDGWDKSLIDTFKEDEKIRIVCPMSSSPQQTVYFDLFHRINHKFLYWKEYVPFFCTMFKRDLVDEIGLLDERFFMYAQDTDYCERTLKKGFKIAVNLETTVKHLHRVSAGKNHKELQQADLERLRMKSY